MMSDEWRKTNECLCPPRRGKCEGLLWERNNAVAERQQQRVVGNDKGGSLLFMASPEQSLSYTLGTVLVEGRRRLVEQEQRLREGQRGRQEETLTLPSREFGGFEVEQGSVDGQGFQKSRNRVRRA